VLTLRKINKKRGSAIEKTQTKEKRERGNSASEQFVQFIFFSVAREWRLLSEQDRESGRRRFEEVVAESSSAIQTHSYSTMGFTANADFMLWRKAGSPEPLQESISQLLATGLGPYLEISELFFGLTKPSVYTGHRTAQEQAIDSSDRAPYFVLYPFTKTADWYLLSKEVRQGMMNEHIKVGRTYPSISQVLLYSTGLADQEFIVGYETASLGEFQDLVIDLRGTEARRYTLSDTPIFTCIRRPLGETLALL
jgi:chlorite dismutase